MAKTHCGSNRWKAIPIAVALLSSVWGADSAFADGLGTPLGTSVNFTLTTNPPGASTNPAGGGPFLLTLNSSNPATLLSSLGIPSSVLAWCIETTQFISVGVPNTAQLYSQAPSKLGGFVSAGLNWLNIVGGAIQFTAAGAAYFSAYTPLGWTADEIAAALQQRIWKEQLGTALPSTIGNQTAAQTTALLTDLKDYASSRYAAYYRLSWSGQDQVFAVPGPIVGAGLPGLLLAFGALLVLARRRQRAA